MDCVSDVQIVAGHANNDHNGSNKDFPMGSEYLNKVRRGLGACNTCQQLCLW
jgi:hypothetical protein